MNTQIQRCHWCGDDPLYIDYHDNEWGVPVEDEARLFEFLLLEGMQAGLSWITVLHKREHMRKVFANFAPEKLSRFTSKKVNLLLNDPGIIRNKLKVNAVVKNAKAYLTLKNQGVDFVEFLWSFNEGKVKVNRWKRGSQIPTSTKEAKAMALALKKARFSFVGETICYAFMQATGMVNDHLVSCYRHQQLAG